jgi:lipopolysaccharide transport system permease protein
LNEVRAKPWIDITPSLGWRSVNVRELWEYRELLYILAWRDVKVRYRQTLLGIGWVLAQPIMTVLIFTVLFHRVAKIQPDVDAPYAVFVMAALVPWSLFASGVVSSGNSLIGSAHLISKVYFPRMIVPASSVLGGLIDSAVTVGTVIVMMTVYGKTPAWSIVLIPLPILISISLTLGLGMWFSALNVEYRDVRIVIPILIQFWLYATPVVYPLGALPSSVRMIARLNPMTPIVNFFRNALLGGTLDWTALSYAAACSAVLLVSGAFYFRRTERQFADVL